MPLPHLVSHISQVRLHTDKVTGRSKGFAHVHFADDAALESALAMDGRALGSRQLRVSYAQPKKEGVHQGGAAATGVGGAEQM